MASAIAAVATASNGDVSRLTARRHGSRHEMPRARNTIVAPMAAATSTPTSTGVVNRPTAPKRRTTMATTATVSSAPASRQLESGPIRCAFGILVCFGRRENRDHTL